MFTKALYYPYILVPDNLWLRRAILYWDKVSPIVPYQVERQIPDNHISKQLLRAGCLEFIHPEGVLSWGDGRTLSEPFLRIVDSDEFQKKLPPIDQRTYTVHIHRDKFSEALLSELRGRNLFTEGEGDWLLFEPSTATIYMGFLASELAKRFSLEPITDSRLYQEGFLRSQISPSGRQDAFLSLVLENLLPAPRDEIPFEDIIRFKERHVQELLGFRKTIRETLDSLAAITDPSQVSRKLEAVRDEMKEHSLLLSRKLSENRIQTVFNVLDAFFRLSMPELAIVVGASSVALPLGAVALGVNAAMKIGKALFEGQLAKNSLLQTNPYSYVFNVSKELQ